MIKLSAHKAAVIYSNLLANYSLPTIKCGNINVVNKLNMLLSDRVLYKLMYIFNVLLTCSFDNKQNNVKKVLC